MKKTFICDAFALHNNNITDDATRTLLLSLTSSMYVTSYFLPPTFHPFPAAFSASTLLQQPFSELASFTNRLSFRSSDRIQIL